MADVCAYCGKPGKISNESDGVWLWCGTCQHGRRLYPAPLRKKKMAAPTHNLQVCPFCQITYHITIGHICPIGPKGDVAAWTEERPYDGE